MVLDCGVDALSERLAKRESLDKWENRKSLEYYRKRFREISAYFGIPLVCVDGKTPEEVRDEILGVPEFYDEVRGLALKDLTYAEIVERDVEREMLGVCEGSVHVFCRDFTYADIVTGDRTNIMVGDRKTTPPDDYEEDLYDDFFVRGDRCVPKEHRGRFVARWLSRGSVEVLEDGCVGVSRSG